jgi:hypothetical protein
LRNAREKNLMGWGRCSKRRENKKCENRILAEKYEEKKQSGRQIQRK